MIREIIFHGQLRERYGSAFRLDVATPLEMISALGSQLRGFRRYIAEGHWHIIRGDAEAGFSYGERELQLPFGQATTVHLMPAFAGAGRQGKAVAKIIAGVALIGFGVAGGIAAGGLAEGIGFMGLSFGQVAFSGGSLLLGGIAALIAPQANTDYSSREAVDRRESFIFSAAPQTLVEQGNPVPLLYGLFETGGVAVHVGMQAEDIAT
jgi:predicted phage tail protein